MGVLIILFGVLWGFSGWGFLVNRVLIENEVDMVFLKNIFVYLNFFIIGYD